MIVELTISSLFHNTGMVLKKKRKQVKISTGSLTIGRHNKCTGFEIVLELSIFHSLVQTFHFFLSPQKDQNNNNEGIKLKMWAQRTKRKDNGTDLLLGQCFSCFRVWMNHQEIELKCRLCFSTHGWEPEILHF